MSTQKHWCFSNSVSFCVGFCSRKTQKWRVGFHSQSYKIYKLHKWHQRNYGSEYCRGKFTTDEVFCDRNHGIVYWQYISKKRIIIWSLLSFIKRPESSSTTGQNYFKHNSYTKLKLKYKFLNTKGNFILCFLLLLGNSFKPPLCGKW